MLQALHLSLAGKKTALVDRHDALGGSWQTIEWQGHEVDAAPYIVQARKGVLRFMRSVIGAPMERCRPQPGMNLFNRTMPYSSRVPGFARKYFSRTLGLHGPDGGKPTGVAHASQRGTVDPAILARRKPRLVLRALGAMARADAAKEPAYHSFPASIRPVVTRLEELLEQHDVDIYLGQRLHALSPDGHVEMRGSRDLHGKQVFVPHAALAQALLQKAEDRLERQFFHRNVVARVDNVGRGRWLSDVIIHGHPEVSRIHDVSPQAKTSLPSGSRLAVISFPPSSTPADEFSFPDAAASAQRTLDHLALIPAGADLLAPTPTAIATTRYIPGGQTVAVPDSIQIIPDGVLHQAVERLGDSIHKGLRASR